MEKSLADLDAAIEPDRSLGGLVLRTKLITIQTYFLGLGVTVEGSYELVKPMEAVYRLGAGEVEVSVDVRNGKIAKLIACPGYRGLLFSKISVGMLAGDAMRAEPRLFYNENEEIIQCQGVEGLAIEVSEIDPPPHLVPSLPIVAISVFAKEVFTWSGQGGEW